MKTDKRRSTYEMWADGGGPREERLQAFERWVYAEMAERLEWPAGTRERERMLGQCRAFVLDAVADLGRHGYLFRPRELAALLREKFDEIGQLQRQGRVANLYPYFRAIWRGWVGRNAEELREQAMSLGAHVSRLTERVEAMPTLVYEYQRETLREARARAARERRKRGAEEAQGELSIDDVE